jgi:cytochrome b pre-mRNA-processing protein 3
MQLPPVLKTILDALGKVLLPDVRKQAAAVYVELVKQARHPWFYERAGVPDTLDGRFEMVVLHLYVYLRRFSEDTSNINFGAFLRALQEYMVDDMDRSFREMGVSDPKVPRRIKEVGEALFGRLKAYDDALLTGKEAMSDAILRNVFAGVEPGKNDVYYIQIYFGALLNALRSQATVTLANGVIRFPDPEETVQQAIANIQ